MESSPDSSFESQDMRSFAPPPLQLSAGQASDGEEDGPIQRVAWDNVANGTANLAGAVPPFQGLQNPGQLTAINVSGYQFNGPLYTLPDVAHQASKDKTVIAVAAAIGGLGLPTSDSFLKKKQLETNIGIQGTVGPNTLTGNKKNIYKGGLDPFLVRVGGTYGAAGAGTRIDLYYQFGVDSYGYITKIEQDGQQYEMNAERGQDPLGKAQKGKLQEGATNDPLFNQFSSGHDTSDPNALIKNKANQSTTDGATNMDLTHDPNAVGGDFGGMTGGLFGLEENHSFVTGNQTRLNEKSDRLDAVAKLGGEGARWECVRNHVDHLKNSSRFYRTDPNNAANVLFMTFQTLWGQWANLFQSKFNIDDGEVANVINANSNKPTVGTDLRTNMTADDYDLGV